jgi:DNA-binding MarR family transcriptional regulator
MAKTEHYKKRIEQGNRTRLLKLLDEHEDLDFSQLKDMLKVSGPTLSNYLTELEKDNRIEATFNTEDRRRKRYRIKSESREAVKSLLGQSEVIKFIEGFSNPIYVYEPPGKRKVSLAFFAAVSEKERKNTEITLRQIGKTLVDVYNEAISTVFHGERLAFVIMLHGKKAGEKA